MTEVFEARVPLLDMGFPHRGLYRVYTLSVDPNKFFPDNGQELTGLRIGVYDSYGIGKGAGLRPRELDDLCWATFTPGGRTVYTNDNSYWRPVAVAPSAQIIWMDVPTTPAGCTDVLGFKAMDVEGARAYFHEGAMEEMAGLSVDDFRATEKRYGWDWMDRPWGKDLTPEQQVFVGNFISRAVPQYSLAHIAKQRARFLEIVEGPISIVPPELARTGYDALPVRVMTGCDGACRMCNFYDERGVNVWPTGKILEEVDALAEFMGWDALYTNRFFLSDGDALVIGHRAMGQVLDRINDRFGLNYEYDPRDPQPGFAYAFAKPATVANMSLIELKAMRRKGLTSVDMGMESGHQPLLDMVKPGLLLDDVEVAVAKLEAAGIDYSVNVIPELGGEHFEQLNLDATVAFFQRVPFNGRVFVAQLDRTEAYMRFLEQQGLPDNPQKINEWGSCDHSFALNVRMHQAIENMGVDCSDYIFIGM